MVSFVLARRLVSEVYGEMEVQDETIRGVEAVEPSVQIFAFDDLVARFAVGRVNLVSDHDRIAGRVVFQGLGGDVAICVGFLDGAWQRIQGDVHLPDVQVVYVYQFVHVGFPIANFLWYLQ